MMTMEKNINIFIKILHLNFFEKKKYDKIHIYLILYSNLQIFL